MGYRKITADKVFDGYRFQENKVLVLHDKGVVVDLIDAADAGEDVEQHSGILSPGFVNCHCHLELSHLSGKIPERTGLVDFVTAVVSHRAASPEVIADAIEQAESEMKAAGIVAVGDICNTPHTITQKAKGALRYHNFIEASGWLPSVFEARLTTAKNLLHAFKKSLAIESCSSEALTANCQLPTANASIVPHAPYSVSPELWQAMKPHFTNNVVSIHNQETACEDEFFRHGTGDFLRMYQTLKIDNSHHLPTGRTSLQSYFHHLREAEKALLVHNTFTTQEDIDYVMSGGSGLAIPPLGGGGAFFCLCPNANLFIEGILPPIELFRKNSCRIVLGTDSLASNWSLNILDEIKAIRKAHPQIPLEEMLRWATSNGAMALGMGDEIGSFEKGKRPGVVVTNEADLSVS